MSDPIAYPIYSSGDHAVTIQLGNTIDIAVNRKVMALFTHLQQYPIIGVKDIIPSYHTVTVVYDLALLKKQAPAVSVVDTISHQLQQAAAHCSAVSEPARLVKIPVCYDLSMAPDLSALAALHQLSIEEVITLHTAQTYRVYMIGFLPGFAYMGSVDAQIATPRKTAPRSLVPAGSVGIAGEQTGIYPSDSPGGWQLIGRTPVTMFHADRQQPCYLRPGDEVAFYPVTLSEFTKLKKP